ncbi:methyl-accepting chemotaxis protein [Pseudomonas donghuensis]|uniref:Cache domain-containing protein n=1 Tax=Pseudomonas donghuensis TaxID=1163398 RepID=A0AAP0SAR5_9PSED|nr:methyl-accepting chemotaxis protein [Pseudomonas donghuensis]KDN97000.2 cache domain-containing protein [Pseudomonas donghuensis]MCP6692398.1 methyl-accepting chemotaxis protein [Pseudomonas donghuensis]MDF9893646.1 methyl-accepting chemotaxis protein [Pseudomonas vranovensis]
MSFKTKILLLTLLPVMLFALVLGLSTRGTLQSQAEQEVAHTRERLLEDSRIRLKDYASIARTSVAELYDRAAPGDPTSRALAISRLSKVKYGDDGYFIGYDSQVVRLFRGDSSEGVGINMSDRKDINGIFLNREMVAAAKNDTHFVNYSGGVVNTDKVVPKLAYSFYLPKWDMIVVTAVNLDSIEVQVAKVRADVDLRVRNLMYSIAITATTLIGIIGALTLLLVRRSLRPLTLIRIHLDEIAAGEGDLTKRLPLVSRDELGQLAGSFNAFIEKIHSLVSQIVAMSEQLNGSVSHVAEQSRQIDRTMDKQRQEADQVAAAINEMSSAAQEVSVSAQNAADAAVEIDRQSRHAGQIVNGSMTRIQALTVELDESGISMKSLQNDVASIVTVLDVIRSIAEQTNLLALNAAIEAARAGAAGRGFAVVADEVRALASRTQRSTQEIQAMVERLKSTTGGVVSAMRQSTQAVQGANAQADQAAEFLGNTVELIATINAMNAQIASAAQEQTSVAEEINRGVHQIARAIDSVAGQTQLGVKTVDEMYMIGNRLQSLLGQFKI